MMKRVLAATGVALALACGGAADVDGLDAVDPSAEVALPECPDGSSIDAERHYCVVLPPGANVDEEADNRASYTLPNGELLEISYEPGGSMPAWQDDELDVAGQLLLRETLVEERPLGAYGTFWHGKECDGDDCTHLGFAAVRAPGGVTACTVIGTTEAEIAPCATLMPQ